MKTIYLVIAILLVSSLSKVSSQELYKLQLDNNNGYAYSLVEQDKYISENKEHQALKFGHDNIKPEYYGRCFDYIQNILSKQISWPLTKQDEMSINVTVNNQGQIVRVVIFTTENITTEDAKSRLVSFIVEVSKWQEPFVPAISADNNKIYGWAWGIGAFKFPVP